MHLNERIVGCDEAKRMIGENVDQWQKGRIPVPLMLLDGPKKSGRTLIARETANYLKINLKEVNIDNYAKFAGEGACKAKVIN